MKNISRRFARTAAAVGLMALAGAFATFSASAQTASTAQQAKPTVVLVHGAFAESSSWDGVIRKLEAQHYP